jgi:hypothetical protein
MLEVGSKLNLCCAFDRGLNPGIGCLLVWILSACIVSLASIINACASILVSIWTLYQGQATTSPSLRFFHLRKEAIFFLPYLDRLTSGLMQRNPLSPCFPNTIYASRQRLTYAQPSNTRYRTNLCQIHVDPKDASISVRHVVNCMFCWLSIALSLYSALLIKSCVTDVTCLFQK